MQKQAPAMSRIAIAIGFSISCFAILLFLWVTFGGPVPLKSKSYRFSADFPETTTLAVESDVRIGGVSVGKVKLLELAPHEPGEPEQTRVEVEVEPQFAPISSDAKAILRQKTLLGETYIELTPGTAGSASEPVSLGSAVGISDAVAAAAEPLPEDGHLADTQVTEAVQIDEIFNALDERTRTSFQRWQQNAAEAIQGRGLDLNDSLGNLGPFLTDSAEIVSILERQQESVKGLIRDSGTVFEAATERDSELADLIRGGEATFGALASEDRALAESFQILPTFEHEAQLTLQRLDSFRQKAHPVVALLQPVAEDVSPTLDSVRRLSPDLRRLFEKLGPLIDAAGTGLPALSGTLHELGPVLDALDPFLANLGPVVGTLRAYKSVVTDFLANAPSGIAGIVEPTPGEQAPQHTVRQLAYSSAETLAIASTRLSTNRGNAYFQPGALNSRLTATAGIFPNFDCKNTDYPPTGTGTDPDEDTYTYKDPQVGPGFAPCVIAPTYPSIGLKGGRFQHVKRDR